MAGKNLAWLEFITKLLALTAAIIGLINAFKLWQGDTSPLTIALLATGVCGVWLGCAYVAFKQGGKWRPWAMAGLVIIPMLTASGVAYQRYQQAQPPNKVIILVANFDEPEPQKYRVTKTVWERLNLALEKYGDVQLERVEQVFEQSSDASAEGEKRKATIVIWGWYGLPGETVPLSVHFEVLRPPKYMPELGPEAKGKVRKKAVAELESFNLQTHLSEEMIYLSLFTVGMARYAAEDWDGAIASFSDALDQTAESVLALSQSIVHFYRGGAYYYKGDYDRAIADYDQAIKLKPDLAGAYYNRGVTYADKKDDYDRAIADFSQAIKLQPDLADAYNNRGAAYADKDDYDSAIADYDQAVKLKPDYAEAYYNRGSAYYFNGDLDRAITDYDQAIKVKPNYANPYYGRGVAYAQKGDKEKAIADFKRFLELSKDPYWRQQAEEQLRELGAK
jgi:tetratricopeptide (TPR) repeat protein